MKIFPWLVAGVGVGVAAYVILSQSSVGMAGQEDLKYAAGRSKMWGAKQGLAGTGKGMVGKVKEGVGKALEDDDLANEGVGDQLIGTVKTSAGRAANALG